MIEFLTPVGRFLTYLSLFLPLCHLLVTFPANLSLVAGSTRGRARVQDAEVRFLVDDLWVTSTLGRVDAAAILGGSPVRSFPVFQGPAELSRDVVDRYNGIAGRLRKPVGA